MIHTICRCPNCHKETTYYDPKIKRTRCTNCDWVNKIDPEMTTNGFHKHYDSIIDKSIKAPKKKVKITLENLNKPIHLSKSILQKAQKEPQSLPNANLWIYKDYIFSSKPTKENRNVKRIKNL